MKKRLLLLFIASILCLFGCGKSEQTNEEINEQLKAMASEISFEEEETESLSTALSMEDEEPVIAYVYKTSVKNPTKTDFKDFYFTAVYVDEDGNEVETIVGDNNVEWKANREKAFYLTGPIGVEKKVESYVLTSANWLKEGNENYVTIDLTK